MRNDWVGFWAGVAGVGTTLLGLAFATFQFRPTQWQGSTLRRLIAVFTLTELAAPVLISLVCLFPGHPWRSAAVGAGASGLCLVGIYWWRYHQAKSRLTLTSFDRTQWRYSWVSFGVALLMLWSTTRDERLGLRLLAGAMVWLLVSGSVESWLFMTEELDTQKLEIGAINRKLEPGGGNGPDSEGSKP